VITWKRRNECGNSIQYNDHITNAWKGRQYLQGFTQTHAMGEDATTTFSFFHFLQRFKARIPHELDALHLMRFKFFQQYWIDSD
jgi:hypothetical protein